MPFTLTLGFFVVAALLVSPFLVRVAAKRSAAQPAGYHPDCEEKVLSSIAAHPGWYVMVHALEPEHFTDLARAQAWERIRQNAQVEVPDAKLSAREVRQLGQLVPADLASRASLSPTTAPHADDKSFLRDASKVYNAGLDRTEFVGRAPVVYDPSAMPPVFRRTPQPGRFQYALAAFHAGAGAAASLLLGRDHGAFAVAGLLVLTVGSVLWTLVDIDTLYIDTKTFWPLTGLAWLLVVMSSVVTSRPLWSVLVGLGAAAAIVGFIEIVNQGFMRLRGQPGMGGGDYLLILATIGIPVAVADSWVLGYWNLMVSLTIGILTWLVARALNPSLNSSTPYAFGPALTWGWVVSSIAWMVTR